VVDLDAAVVGRGRQRRFLLQVRGLGHDAGPGHHPALGGDVGNTYLLVMGMWFGSRTIEKVARIFKR
jgi:hypothetical protein